MTPYDERHLTDAKVCHVRPFNESSFCFFFVPFHI